MAICRFQRSSLGAFVRSNLGVRGQKSGYQIDGVSTVSAISSLVIYPAYSCASVRFDSPIYGTMSTLANSASITTVGQLRQAGDGTLERHRYRCGFTFALESSYPTTNDFTFYFKGTGPTSNANTELWYSNSDDHSLYTVGSKVAYDWEDNFDNQLTSMSISSSDVSVTVPYSTISAYLGSNISFVLNVKNERLNTFVSNDDTVFTATPVLLVS